MILDSDVQLIKLKSGFCINHALLQKQIFGSSILKEYFSYIQKKQFDKIPEDLLNELKRNKFLIDETEKRAVEHLIAKEDKREEKVSLNLLRILLTDICNLRCLYCKVVHNIKEAKKTPTPKEKIEDVISFFFSQSNPTEEKIIHITGGEPTLFFEDIKNIINLKNKYQRKNENVWVVIGTNAVALTEEQADFLAKNNIKCIVSMDGYEEIHDIIRKTADNKGSWQAVDKGIKLLKSKGAEVSISMVVGKHNIKEINSIVDWFIKEYQPTGLGVNFMKPPTKEQKDFEFLLDEKAYADTMYQLHKNFRDKGLFLELVYRKLYPFVEQKYRFHDCGAANGSTINIDAKGNVGPCKSFLILNKLYMEKLDAEHYKNTMAQTWRKRSPIYFESCENCAARGICGNGCAYEALLQNEDELTIDIRFCQYTKYFHELFMEDLFDLLPSSVKEKQNWWYVPTKEDRLKMMGNVKAIPHTLSYSIGHHTFR